MLIQNLHEGVAVEVQDSPEKVSTVQLSREATRRGSPLSCSPGSLKPYKGHVFGAKHSTIFPERPTSQGPKLVLLNWEQSWPAGHSWQCLETLDCHTWSRAWSPEMLLNILQRTGHAAQPRSIWPQVSIVSWLRDPDGDLSPAAWEEVVPRSSPSFLSGQQTRALGREPERVLSQTLSQPTLSSFCFASQNENPWHLKRLNKTHDSQPLRLRNPAPHILFPSCTPNPHSWSTVGNWNCNLYCPALKGWACFLSQGQSLLNVLPPFEMSPQPCLIHQL